MDSIELELLDRIKSKVNDLIEENINLRNAFEEACKSNDDLYAKFLKIKSERDAAVADLRIWSACKSCKHHTGEYQGIRSKCGWDSKWEWRGAQHDEP